MTVDILWVDEVDIVHAIELSSGRCPVRMRLPLLVAILTMPNDNLTMVRHEYLKAGKDAICVEFPHVFVGHAKQNSTDPPFLALPPHYPFPPGAPTMDFKSVDMGRKLMFLLDYVVGNPEIEWLFRLTVDALWNFRELRAWVAELPDWRAPHVIGDCVWGPGVPRPFLQGGSGFLISRRAAELLAPHKERYWADLRGAVWEDRAFGWFVADILNISGHDMTSTRMGGHWGRWVNGMQQVRESAWSSVPRCPNLSRIPPTLCRRFLAPIRRHVVYHEMATKEPGFFERNAAALFDAPANIKWYHDELWPFACLDQDDDVKLEAV